MALKRKLLSKQTVPVMFGGLLSLFDHNNILRPVAYHSKRLTSVKCNFEIHDKELPAIISVLEVWQGELVGLKDTFLVLSDHKILQYFMTSKKLSERQTRWSQILAQFNFEIRFRAGKNSARPDAHSRRIHDMPQNLNDERLRFREIQLL